MLFFILSGLLNFIAIAQACSDLSIYAAPNTTKRPGIAGLFSQISVEHVCFAKREDKGSASLELFKK
jgi:hypothetical protein